MRITDIKVPERARQHLGWLDDLERSIEYRGLLQPIGVTPSAELVFGARRLQACKNLGWEEIPARVLDLDASDPAAALKAERDENEIRKDFTPSEKVAIADRIEQAMAGRHGGDRKSSPKHLGVDPAPKGESADLAAAAVGWSGEQYRQAKKVAKDADPETKAAVDEGKMSVNKAYQKVTGKRPLSITVRLAYDIEPDANVIISKAGVEYATKLALAIMKVAGHEVNYG